MRIRDLMVKAGDASREKGWREKARSPLEAYALIHSEVSEAVEEARLPARPFPMYQMGVDVNGFDVFIPQDSPGWDPKRKPQGELAEMADIVIRCLEYSEYRGWDLEDAIEKKMAYNSNRPYRHGGKQY